MKDFRLIMFSAGFEHGGNVVHRHLDGHPDLLVYPFESQLGNPNFSDFLSSIERVQYRYPEFPEGLSAEEYYNLMYDEELKTFLRKKVGSKFKDVDLKLSEQKRIEFFKNYLGESPFTRRRIIKAFFQSTFASWENYYTNKREDMIHVGYSPSIAIDANRMVKDFPDIRIVHIVRNPFSAYRDTKRRPFPQPLFRYLITWNVYHSTVEMYSKIWPQNIKIFRYEDLIADKKKFMMDLTAYVGINFHESLLYPSWNGKEITQQIAPWGTVLKCTMKYNRDIIDELSLEEKRIISYGTLALSRHFGYTDLGYLKELYKL